MANKHYTINKPISLTFYNLAVTLRNTRFNIQNFYMVLTLHLCVLYGSHKNSNYCLAHH